jgi:phosphatidylinositol glycan class W
MFSHVSAHASLISNLSGASWPDLLLPLVLSCSWITLIRRTQIHLIHLSKLIRSLLAAALITLPLLASLILNRSQLQCSCFLLFLIVFLCSSSSSSSSYSFSSLLSSYRVLLSLLTNISIYGIDCPLFPRFHGKTEEFGLSLMDIGIGSVAVSMGFTTTNKQGKTQRIVGLMTIGTVRTLVNHILDYPVHISEYGSHWNFFISLSILTLAQSFLASKSHSTCFVWGITLIIAHQIILMSGAEDFGLRADRHYSLIHENREGLLGLPGLIALLAFGRALQPYLFNYSHEKVNRLLFFLAILLHILYYFSCMITNPSRRLFNITYSISVLAFNIDALLTLVTLSRLCPASSSNLFTSLLSSHSRHSLIIFLLANLSVGILNFLFNPSALTSFQQFGLLALHSIINGASPALIGLV